MVCGQRLKKERKSSCTRYAISYTSIMRLKPEKPLKPSAIRLTAEDWEKLRQLGGVVWIRKKIKAARLPQRIEGASS